MMEPTGYEDRVPLRLFASQLGVMADNLLANPGERSLSPGWGPIEVHQLVTAPSDASQLALYDANRAKFASLSPPIRVIPGFRVHPSGTRALWFDISYWTTLAASASAFFAGRRDADNPTIDQDVEGYGDGIEPCDDNAIGTESYATFCVATQPYFNMLLAMDPPPIVSHYPVGTHYPDVRFTTGSLHYFTRRLVELLGRDRVHFVTESPANTWDLAENYRCKTSTTWALFASYCSGQINDMETLMGGPCKFRSFGDADLLRDWAQLFTPDIWRQLSRMAPQIYDNTRVTGDREQWGTPAARHGTTMSLANECQYAWAFPPLQQTHVYSVGKGTSTITTGYHGSSSSQSIGPVSVVDDIAGWRLHPDGSNTFAALRMDGVMPTSTPQAWTLSCSFQVPAGLAVDTALFGQDKVNVNSWHVYWRVSDSALVWERNGQTQALATGLGTATTINFALARNGNTDWRWSVNGAAAQNFTAGTNLAPQDHFMFGGGKIPGNPGSGSAGFMMSCVDFLAMHVKIAHIVCSDATLAVLSAGHYVYGRLTTV